MQCDEYVAIRAKICYTDYNYSCVYFWKSCCAWKRRGFCERVKDFGNFKGCKTLGRQGGYFHADL